MVKIGICDDEKTFSGQLEKIILEVCKKEKIDVEVDVFEGGLSLEKQILLGIKYDLLYLDIQMNQGNGIETAKNVRKMDENVLFIFVSSYEKYLMDLFRLDVFTFIKKPIDLNNFIKIFLDAYKKICSKICYFDFRYKGEEYKILCYEILYFESNGRKINIYMRNEKVYELNSKLSEVVAKLEKCKIPFLRIHQSYLVNYLLIISRSKSTLTLINDKKLPISEDRQKEFGMKYSILLGGEIDV